MPYKEIKPLYEDEVLRVTLLPNCIEDHAVYHKAPGEEFECLLPLPRGVLREFALAPSGDLEMRLNTMDPTILFHLRQKNISVDKLHVAICQAYAEEERRFVRECMVVKQSD
ncbi:MAG: hypothetical protein PHD81_02980 [Candidatus Nanoarchaeia archaeon]|nr:hypothetical protein [Candidatus Nanoarchaeia archaeon]MDD5588048.1 hypothetical protein [Candidatus Nanoarchaeia archaeon]